MHNLLVASHEKIGGIMKREQATFNNVKMQAPVTGRCKYAFVDSVEHRADRILIGALIPVSYEHGVAQRTEDGFELRICSFESKYEQWFANCMDDLAWVLEGDTAQSAYVQACHELLPLCAAA